MTRAIVILRPDPGSAATAERVRAAGLDPLLLPLFAVVPLDWTPPDPAGFDALLLTSANAVRHAGPGLERLAGLPVLAVGPETAEAAAAADLNVTDYGSAGVAALLAGQPSSRRLLWLAGRERTAIDHPGIRAVIPIYASEGFAWTPEQAAQLPGSVALIHSARALHQLAAQLDAHSIPRASVRIATISARAADADAHGWDRVAIAAQPNDTALIDAARPLAIDP